jgi:diaminopimelate decarboxylase
MPTTRDERGMLRLGGVDLAAVLRQTGAGTPTYVYDLDAIAAEARALEAAFEGAPHLVAYAVKANSAGPVIRALAGEGCGADVVSGAELGLALGCAIPPDRIVYSGVAKLAPEIDSAIGCGERGIAAIQLESIEEITRVEARAAAQGRRVRVSARINPAAAAGSLDTHAHIATGHDEAKFGIPRSDVGTALAAIGTSPHLELVGLSVHIGSQLSSTGAYALAARDLFAIARQVRGTAGARLAFVDTGGGFGVDYEGTRTGAVRPADFVREARREQREAGLGDLALYVEPGRSLVAAHGVLLARVVQQKTALAGPGERRWLMIDAGMNDLIRPALYQARHRIVSLTSTAPRSDATVPWRVVGPVCESSDDFGEHELPREPPGEVAILDAGAYGFTMASHYNGRALPAEVFLRGGQIHKTSPRGSQDQWVLERLM